MGLSLGDEPLIFTSCLLQQLYEALLGGSSVLGQACFLKGLKGLIFLFFFFLFLSFTSLLVLVISWHDVCQPCSGGRG